MARRRKVSNLIISRLAKQRLSAGVGLLLTAFLGCGTAEYKERMSIRVEQLGKETPYSELVDTAIGATGVKIGKPEVFKTPPLTPASGVDQRRLMPPGVPIPDLQNTYEDFIVDSTGGRIPYYCYVAVTDMAVPGARDSVSTIQMLMRKAYSSERFRETAAHCKTPDGRAVVWKEFHISVDQEFYYENKDGQGDFRIMKGTLEFYARQEEDLLVVIGWRVPDSIRGKDFVDVDKWAPMTAGSMVLEIE